MTTNTEPKREPGYPGALPPRDDSLGRSWILIVLGIFVLIVVLAIAGVPSRFIPEETPIPLPSTTPATSVSASASAEPSESAGASAEPSASVSAAPSASAEASAAP